MKRKVFAITICILLLGCILPVAVFGTETDVAPADQGEYNTVFTRVWEFITDNKTMVGTAVGDVVVLLAFARSAIKSRKKNEGIASQLQSLKRDSASMPELVDAINLMVDVFNKLPAEIANMRALLESNSAGSDDRNKVTGALLAQTTAILEIITTGYSNSDLPQGIKDLVTLKYAKCLRSIEDDTAKCAVEAARAIISGEVASSSDESVTAVEITSAEVETAEV